MKNFYKISLTGLFLLVILCGTGLGKEEEPLKLPVSEGSKSFDFEIDQINDRGIQFYQQGQFSQSIVQFKKALNLAEQLKDPSQGILNYNLALSLHKADRHEESTEQFYAARRLALGNPRILGSELLKMHECGYNPSVSCKKEMRNERNIEGSN